MPDFKELNKRPLGTAERPLPIPVGTYTFIVKSKQFGKSPRQKTDYIEFELVPQAPEADVGEAELQAYLNRYKNLGAKSIRATFYYTEDAIFRLREFHEKFDYYKPEMDPDEANSRAVGNMIRGHVVHQQGQNGAIYANIDTFTRAQ